MTAFELDGRPVSVEGDDLSLLDALRERLGCISVKDGCSPQGQCGCCTVLVDGAARVSCVTPLRRVAGRAVTTVDGLDPQVARRWADAFVAAGASQCGFCTPGIIMRLAALHARRPDADEAAVRSALLAHLCRCTGWQSIIDAARSVITAGPDPDSPSNSDSDDRSATAPAPQPDRQSAPAPAPAPAPDHAIGRRDPLLAAWRAQIEGPAFQQSGPDVVLGRAGFADDTAPPGARVALADAKGGYTLADDVSGARRVAGKVQGRNSTVGLRHPLEAMPGEWLVSLRTTFVEPAYLEPDASWCVPGGRPASPLANGGAFGGKRCSPVGIDARRLADESGETVRVLWSREETVRRGPKRPPISLGLAADGTGRLRIACTPGSPDLAPVVDHVRSIAPGLEVEVVEVAGPPVSGDLRCAVWGEVMAAVAVAELLAAGAARAAGPGRTISVTTPSGGKASVSVSLPTRVPAGGPPPGSAAGQVEGQVDGRAQGIEENPVGVVVEVWAGDVLDEVTLRSYCLGAVHQALGMVWQEGLAVDERGEVLDLTIRSFGILDARETPAMHVTTHPEVRWPINGSDAVFVATLAAAWLTEGLPGSWPTRRSAGANAGSVAVA